MKRSTMCVIMLASSFFILTGCANMGDVLASKNEGTAQVYAVSADKAWGIAMNVLHQEGGESIEEHRKEGYMLTTVGANLISAGSVIGVWVEPVNRTSTKVTIVSKRKIQTSIATGLTESTFHQQFAQEVAGAR